MLDLLQRFPPLRTVLLVLAVGTSFTLLRAVGAFEGPELLVYDTLIRARAALVRVPVAPVTLVSASEADLNHWGWPITDEVLARAIERLEEVGPSAIGIDLYRDRPRPPGAERLTDALRRFANIIVAFKFAGGEASIPPPDVLRGTDRVGFVDTVADPGGVVRRGLLFADDGTSWAVSMPLRLAIAHLASDDGIRLHPDPRHPEFVRLGKATIPPLGANDGGYAGIDDAGYQMLIDYRGGWDAFPRLDLTTVLEGNFPVDQVRGRIVLLGVGADSVKDLFYTPLSSGGPTSQKPMFGNELQAHIAAQLVALAKGDISPTAVPRPLFEPAWILFWTAVGGAVAAFTRRPIVLATGGAIVVTSLGAIALAGFLGSIWIPIVPAAIGSLASAGLVTALGSWQERAQRELLMRIFEQNVSPAIAEMLWKQRDAFMAGTRPRSQRLVATVLFTDLRGFTALSESADPDMLIEWLNTYLERMAEIVSEHGGIVDKFIGDAIMAVFGVPIPRRAPAERAADARNAVECALAMERAVTALNVEWMRAGRPNAAMRVGIFTGPLVAGAVGGTQRLNYTVIGDTVNTASRLESFDRSIGKDLTCRILIGEPTRELIGDVYRLRYVGDVLLKGKSQPIAVHLLEGVNDVRPVTDMPARRGETGPAKGERHGS
jgi:adenylate cyclase